MRKANDFYPTPPAMVDTLVHQLRLWWGEPTGDQGEPDIWEPCCGDDRLAEALRGQGYGVISTDISKGEDFFDYDKALSPVLCTNPPFKKIRQLIDRAFEIGVEQMALICPERLWACEKGRKQLERYRPSLWANLSFREDYLGKKGSPDRSLAIAIWDRPSSTRTHYEVWGRVKH
jgi:hypothetical protein